MTLLEIACRRLARRDGRDPDNWFSDYCGNGARLRVQAEIDLIVNRALCGIFGLLCLAPVVIYFFRGLSCE